MDDLPGKLIAVHGLATLLAAGAGAWRVRRYRVALAGGPDPAPRHPTCAPSVA